MHKNAIKNERGVNFLEILPQKLVIFQLFWAFLLVIFVTFWLRTRNFQQKSSGNTGRAALAAPQRKVVKRNYLGKRKDGEIQNFLQF